MAYYVTDIATATVYVPELVIDGSSTPNTSQVENFVTQREAQLHSALRKYLKLKSSSYALPLTHVEDIALAEMLVSQIVAVDIYISAYGNSALPDHLNEYREDWNSFLKMAKDGSLELAGDSSETTETPAFLIGRTPTRDDYFSERGGRSDWDE